MFQRLNAILGNGDARAAVAQAQGDQSLIIGASSTRRTRPRSLDSCSVPDSGASRLVFGQRINHRDTIEGATVDLDGERAPGLGRGGDADVAAEEDGQ